FGVPYITEADINQKYERHSVADVYANILADLEEAAPFIPEISANNAHPNKAALHSFYARVYLSMGDYERALSNANSALVLNGELLDLNDYEKAEGTTWGRVHLKGNPSERMPDIDHPEANYVKWLSGSLQGSVMLSHEMRDVYAKDLNGAIDLRKEYFFSEDMADLGGSPNYFPGECAFVLYSNFNVGFTSVENYFIAAECEARIGSRQRALQLVNKVRENRLQDFSELQASTNEEALIKVLEEKRREFCLKGPMRLFDLKRLNLEQRFQKTITHTADGETFTLPANDIRYVLPVNQEILEFNPDFPVYER
ncbi:MAG: RagB/SusD family nutrient uptake outer membrane protein, partial [Bacteroidia bacterium]|nr:RagB/SusD family nutrient uptake outer membrane protein [Bacteroidia bacterium]